MRNCIVRAAARSSVLLAAISLTACEGGAGNGPETLQKVATLLQANDIETARKLMKARRPLPVRYLDQTDPEFCSTAAIKARVDNEGYRAASALIELQGDGADAVTRYAVAKSTFENAVRAQGMIVESYCREGVLEAQATLMDASDSLTREMAPIIADLHADAIAQVGENKLPDAMASAVEAHSHRGDEKFAAMCREWMAKPSVAEALDTPAIVKQADKDIRARCEALGFKP